MTLHHRFDPSTIPPPSPPKAPTPLGVILRLGLVFLLYVAAAIVLVVGLSGASPAQAQDEQAWIGRILDKPYYSRKQAYKHSTIEYIPVTKHVPVLKVPEHYVRLDRPDYGKQARWGRGKDKDHGAPFRIPAPGWGTYHADWIDKGNDRHLCLREQIPVVTSEFKRGDKAASKTGKLNWSGAVRSILGEPWMNWDEAIDRVEQCWHSGTGERNIDMHMRCRVAARPCWSVDKQIIDAKPKQQEED